MMETADTGSATMNQDAQSSGGTMACSAMIFWGEEIGELCPPIFAASAIASYAHRVSAVLSMSIILLTMRHGPNDDFGGRVRRIGYYPLSGCVDRLLKGLTRINVKHSVGAATLLGRDRSSDTGQAFYRE
jgi:hypothetical protein